jgi:uroporphyrinogen-III decarboxylase
MSGKELVLAAIRGKETERVPWVPFVGCHAASLLGISARELLQSAERIVEGQVKAAELYLPDGLPVTFDLQIEAEVLGCKLQWADENPPAVVDHLSDGS